MGPEEDLMELIWQNGNVVMHSQNHDIVPAATNESKQVLKPPPAQKFEETLMNSIQEDENALWFQCSLDDPLDKDFCLEFLSETIENEALESNKISLNTASNEQAYLKFSDTQSNNNLTDTFRRPASSFKNEAVLNVVDISKLVKGKASESLTEVRGQDSSEMTIGSSICASNHIITTDIDPCRTLSYGTVGVVAGSLQQHAKVQNNEYEATVITSLNPSDYSAETSRQKTRNQNHKRKRRESEDLGQHSEAAECESVEPKKLAKRKSRAAEVHNLAERRRRDRINEKMKALQELIPNSSKTDKASMLDGAIEYMKSLQMQLQMMRMGGGMSPIMFQGFQQYFSGMCALNVGHYVAAGPATNESTLCHPSDINMSNFPSPLQRVLPEPYGCYLGFQHMQPQPEAMNFSTGESPIVQQESSAAVLSGSIFPIAEGAAERFPKNSDKR